MNYPINLKLRDRKCLVVGGGHVAERKVLGLVLAGAKVTVISPEITEKLMELSDEGEIEWFPENYQRGEAKDFFLVVAATNDENINKMIISDGRLGGALINAPTNPDESDFFVPAAIRRGELTVTVSTEGASPAFARALKEEISRLLPENLGEWLIKLRKIRNELKIKLAGSKNREMFWKHGLNANILKLVGDGKLNDAEVELRNGFSRNWSES